MAKYISKDVGTVAFLLMQPSAELRPYDGEVGVKSVHMTVEIPGISEDGLANLLHDFRNAKSVVEPQAFMQKQGLVKQFIFSVKGSK